MGVRVRDRVWDGVYIPHRLYIPHSLLATALCVMGLVVAASLSPAICHVLSSDDIRPNRTITVALDLTLSLT